MLYVKLDKPTSLPLSFLNNSYHEGGGRKKQIKEHAGRQTRKSGRGEKNGGEQVAGNSFKYQGHLK